jgi:hypothetical protein
VVSALLPAQRKATEYLKVAEAYGLRAELVDDSHRVAITAANGDTLTIWVEGDGPLYVVGRTGTLANPDYSEPLLRGQFGAWFKQHQAEVAP